jgi:hypothetical protein
LPEQHISKDDAAPTPDKLDRLINLSRPPDNRRQLVAESSTQQAGDAFERIRVLDQREQDKEGCEHRRA